LADKIKTVVATVLSALVAFGVLDVGQGDAITALVAAALTLYAALSVKPLGPAGSA
jgi:hypothetical protein